MTARYSRARCFVALMALSMAQGPSAHAGPFEVRDNGWEGGSELLELARSELGGVQVIPVSVLDRSALRPEDALLLLHPDHPLSGDKLAAFLGAGGRVAVVDDFGAGDKILERF